MSAAEDLQQPAPAASPVDWLLLGRILLKAAVLFAALNVAFAVARPLDTLGRFSLYNSLFPGRLRLPYGEIPADAYNLTLSNIPANFAAHVVTQPAAADEYRVLLIGDSATWGWFLANEDTLAGQLNTLGLRPPDGRRVVVYNLGYPAMSLTKDLLLLDEALAHSDADLILWPVTLQSFARGRQLDHPVLFNNGGRVRGLISRYGLAIDPADPRFSDDGFAASTIVAQRRALADLLRLQTWGLAWAASGHDQAIPAKITPRANDLPADESWLDIAEERPLTEADLAFDALRAGFVRAGAIPVVLINEPMFIADGANSDIRYNSFYPRWAYDQYRALLSETAAAEGWTYFDLWDAIAPQEFSDTPVHLTAEGSRQFAALLAEMLAESGAVQR